MTKHLNIYELKVIEESNPDDEPDPEPNPDVYVWAGGGECDACTSMVGTILDSPDIPKPHPNCRCFAVLMP